MEQTFNLSESSSARHRFKSLKSYQLILGDVIEQAKAILWSQLQQESKKEKSAKAPTEKKQAAASLEKQKIAEEIKLNVAAMGMDLLNNSSAAPTQVNKVNNLIIATSPKGLGTNGDFKDHLNSDADDEKSPDPKIEMRSMSAGKLSAGSPKRDEKTKETKFSIQAIENTDESEEDETLETGQ